MGSFGSNVSHDVHDFVREADAQLARYSQHIARFQELAADAVKRRSDIQTRLRAAAVQLAAALLPDLTPAAFQALADKLGAPEIVGLEQRSEQRRQQIDARVAQIEQDERYQSRDTLRMRLEQQLEEVKPLYDYAVQDLQLLNGIRGLQELVARGYDTPSYPYHGWSRFFHLDYLHDWRRADEICEQLKVPAFSEIVTRYKDRDEQVEVLGRTVRDLQGQLAAIAALESERERLLTEREALPDNLRYEAGLRVAGLLQGGPALVDRLPDPEAVRARLPEIAGMEHQVEYLDSLRTRIEEDASRISEQADKLLGERTRYANDMYRYRNKTFTQEQFDKRFGRDARYDRLYNRYATTSQTIYVFDDYYRVDPFADILWWDVMTGGRIDGSWVPDVQQYTEAHPDYSYDRTPIGPGVDGPGFDSGGDYGDHS